MIRTTTRPTRQSHTATGEEGTETIRRLLENDARGCIVKYNPHYTERRAQELLHSFATEIN